MHIVIRDDRGNDKFILLITLIPLVAFAFFSFFINSLSANPAKWPNTLKQFVGELPTNCLSVPDHFVKLAFKGLNFNLNWRLWFIQSWSTHWTVWRKQDCIFKLTSEKYPKSSWPFKMELVAKIFSGWKPLTIFEKNSS